MKTFSDAREAVVPIPLDVVAVNVHVALVVIAVEDRIAFRARYFLFHHPLNALEVEYYPAS